MITASQTDITLPDIRLGESHTFEVLITNTYPFTVHVGTGVGCGSCTTAGLYPDQMVPPGGTRLLKIKYTPNGGVGATMKRVYLNYLPQGETTAHKDTITFKANVVS